jgi:DNA polymerase-3 subunit delta
VTTRGKAALRTVYAVVGTDRFFRNEAVAGLVASLTAADDRAVPVRMEADVELASVLDEVRTMTLLGERRLVIVDDADDLIQEHRSVLERFASGAATDGVLILSCASLPKNTRLHRIIHEKGGVIAADPPKGRAFIPWLVERARNMYQRTLSTAAARRLVELLGENAAALDSELGKLATFAADRKEITPADVDRLTGLRREELVFRVMDAIHDGNAAEAFAAWEQVLATDRAAAHRSIGGLAWAARRMLELRDDLDRGASEGEIARRLYPPVDATTFRRRMERMPRKRIEAEQRDLLNAELGVRSGVSTLEMGVEKVIARYATD